MINKLTSDELCALKILKNSLHLGAEFTFYYFDDGTCGTSKYLIVRFRSKDILFVFANEGIKNNMSMGFEKFNNLTIEDLQKYIDFYFESNS